MDYRPVEGCVSRNRYLYTDRLLGLVLLILWCQRTVLSYIIQLISYVDITGIISKSIIPAIITVLLLLTYRRSLSKIKAVDVLLYLFTVIIGLLSYLNPDNEPALDSSLAVFLLSVFPFYFLGLIMPQQTGYEKILRRHTLMDLLYYISTLGIIVAWAYQIYLVTSGKQSYSQFTQGAVNVLPSVMFCIYYAFKRKKPTYTIIAIAGVVLLVFLGTRAALFSALVMICCCLHQKKNRHLRIGAIVLFALYLVFSSIINEYFARVIAPKLVSVGLSSRVVDMLLGKKILDSSNRFSIYLMVLSRVIDRPILGYGLFGDRAFFSIAGSYSHDIIIEFFVDFGIVFGAILAGAIIIIYIKALKKCTMDDCTYGLILSLICAVSVRLLLSQSYLHEQDFFLLLGLCVGALRTKDYSNIEEYK